MKSVNKSIYTTEYLTNEPENMYFDRKSAQIKPRDLADLMSAFANAEGGTIAIGISDKTKAIEGINSCGEEKINLFINAPKDYCRPMPDNQAEFVDVVNAQGENDRILLLHIKPMAGQVITTINDSVYLRMGDKTREMKGDDLRNLEYSKGMRLYEDECNLDATIADLDDELINEYKQILNAGELSSEQVLRSRGFIKIKEQKEYLTNAAVLLFARNINQFYPNCRIRFIRYDGYNAQVGVDINIIKDVNIELPILKIIDKAKEFIATQLRDFTALNISTGKFQIVPEYPEFAWLEGIVNAVTHREYSMSGGYISVKMYNDRLEIESPGKLPNIVTVDNIQETRYSRNPRIARVLTEFGWVRELNEGVKRIYADMQKFFLDDPIYENSKHSVKLVLKNNIVMRTIRMKEDTRKNIGEEVWDSLDDLSKRILEFMGAKNSVTRSQLQEHLGKSSNTIKSRLKFLIELGVIVRNGQVSDPTQTYSILIK